MQKNILKFIGVFVSLVCIFYFFNKIQNKSIDHPDKPEQTTIHQASLPEDFHEFYDQFHTDSIFQLERIIFPLKGLASSTDTTQIAEEVSWQRRNWILHKPFDNHNGTFERVFTNIGGIISEQISASNGLFTLEKRYAKLSGEWHLIYYQELLMNG